MESSEWMTGKLTLYLRERNTVILGVIFTVNSLPTPSEI